MSKRKGILLSAAVCFLMFGVAAFLLLNCTGRGIYYRWFYQGNHIHVNLFATIDAKPVDTDDIHASICSENLETGDISYKNISSLKLKDNGKSTAFSIEADDYGDYHIIVSICGYDFMLDAYQWNCWDVQTSDLYIDIDTKNGKYKTHETYSFISEADGYIKVKENRTETTNALFQRNILWICSD